MEQYFRISQLIANSAAGTITPEEQAELDIWLAASPANRATYSGLLDRAEHEREVQAARAFDRPEAWRRLTARRRTAVRKARAVRMTAVAAAVAVSAVAGVWLFTARTPAVELTGLLPGDNKARLTLADGSVVDLLTHTGDIEAQGVVIGNEDNTVSYDGAQAADARQGIYNVLATPKGGEYRLRLGDGTLVHLNAESRVRFPVMFTGGTREVELSGEAFFEVEEDAARPFIVRTHRGDITVLGTSFNVKAYADEAEGYTTLVSGSVGIEYAGRTVVLAPGEQAVAGDGIATRTVDLAEYTGWKDGAYTFNGRTVEAIMDELGRWYDFDVVYGNEAVRGVKFTGSLRRRETIGHFMQLLGRTDEVSCRIEGRTITLY